MWLALCVVASCALAHAADTQTIFDMDSVSHRPNEITVDNKKIPAGTAELVDGKFGKAVRFTFVDNSRGGFMVGRIRPTPGWDSMAGFSFW